MRTRTKAYRIAEASAVGRYGRTIEFYLYIDEHEDGTEIISYKVLHTYYNRIRGWYYKHYDTLRADKAVEDWHRLRERYRLENVYLWNINEANRYKFDYDKLISRNK